MIRCATGGDAMDVAMLIGRAFQPLAVAQWLVPHPTRRASILPANFLILVEHALDHGQIHLTEDRRAAAVWFHRHAQPPPPPHHYGLRLRAACAEATARFEILDKLFDQNHPEAPHHHLAFLAVHPGYQRQGLGSALLAHHHTHLDTTGTAAYLEATSEDAKRLYERHGYLVMGGPFRLPDETPIWPMWRQPETVYGAEPQPGGRREPVRVCIDCGDPLPPGHDGDLCDEDQEAHA